jgi:DNA phosphorothioation-associated putative methyltransferase
VDLAQILKDLNGGKRVHGSRYFHVDTIRSQNLHFFGWLQEVVRQAAVDPSFDLVRIDPAAPLVSFLSYPDFRSDPHPALRQSTLIRIRDWSVRKTSYSVSTNRPILHRKETFLASTDRDYVRFRALTYSEESAGLLGGSNKIGYERAWKALLEAKGYRILDHELLRTR